MTVPSDSRARRALPSADAPTVTAVQGVHDSPRTHDAQLTIRMPRDLRSAFAAACRVGGLTPSEAGRQAVEAYVEAAVGAVADENDEGRRKGPAPVEAKPVEEARRGSG